MDKLTNHYLFLSMAGLSSIGGFLLDFDIIKILSITLIFFIIGFIILTIEKFSTVRVEKETIEKLKEKNKILKNTNKNLKIIPEEFDRINRIYKDTLASIFHKTSSKEILAEETKALNAVCQRINRVFYHLIKVDCMVTVKLISKSKSKNKQYFVQTQARNEEHSVRDHEKNLYEVSTGNNTAFDAAVQKKQKFYYFSPDLTQENNYNNERENYLEYYKNTLIVAIFKDYDNKRGEKIQGLTGFLCIDTKQTNVLNDSYHVDLLRAFANQMYNFISLNRYKISEIKKQTL